jgi:hypothetical protein
MTAKTSRPAPAQEGAGADRAPLNLLTDLGRRQFSLATESMGALLRGSEAMRKIQQQTAHQASLHQEAAAQKLHEPCEPADLLAIQSDLLRLNLQGATQYWQQLTANALKTQVEMMGCASRLLDAESGNGIKPVLETWQAAMASPATQVPAAFKPVLETWQSVLTGSPNGSATRPTAH